MSLGLLHPANPMAARRRERRRMLAVIADPEHVRAVLEAQDDGTWWGQPSLALRIQDAFEEMAGGDLFAAWDNDNIRTKCGRFRSDGYGHYFCGANHPVVISKGRVMHVSGALS